MSHVHLSGSVTEHVIQNCSSNTCGWEQKGRGKKKTEWNNNGRGKMQNEGNIIKKGNECVDEVKKK